VQSINQCIYFCRSYVQDMENVTIINQNNINQKAHSNINIVANIHKYKLLVVIIDKSIDY
jgi:hypothetical protein